MNWSQMGEKATREILKQLLFIISSQIARQDFPCVLGAERQQRPFLCSFVTIQRAKLLFHTKGTRESAGKRCNQANRKISSVTQVCLGWQGVILGKDGCWRIQWVSTTPAPCGLMLMSASRTRCLSPPSNTGGFCGWSAADQRATTSN